MPRLYFFARTLLGYSSKESKLLTITEVCEQTEEYCKFYGLKMQDVGEGVDEGEVL